MNEISWDDALSFILAGKSIFTIENESTRNRFTFKISKPRDFDMFTNKIWFVSLLSGPDNNSNYSYMGIIDRDMNFRLTKKSRVSEKAISMQAFKWVYSKLKNSQTKQIPETVHFYHEGRCGRCGRRLTVPKSIKTGFGPTCYGYM